MRRVNFVAGLFAILALGLLLLGVKALPTISSRFTLSSALPGVANSPIGYDPLTEQEQNLALMNALQAQKSANLSASAVDSLEVLLVERHEVPKAERANGNWQRQGDVYLYDYTTDSLIQSTVDVQTGALVASETVQGVQLPLTQREEDRSLSLIRADSVLWSTLTARFQSLTGNVLDDFSQLQVKVSLFRADAMPDKVNDAAKDCGQHRCAQVLIFTTDKTLLEMMPIVDLSQGKVVQVME